MCKVSDKIKFCSCATTNVQRLKHYWVWHQYNKDKSIIIYSEIFISFDEFVNKLIISHGQLPTHAKTQNELWYKLYKLNKDDLVIQLSHGKFLLGRDLTSISFLFLVFVGLPFLIIGKFPLNIIYFLLLAFDYLILIIVTRNHGNRFVTNVLALESSK